MDVSQRFSGAHALRNAGPSPTRGANAAGDRRISPRFPDRATLRAALSLATRAPSAYDVQPWRWKVGPAHLHLHRDADGKLDRTDPGGRHSTVSCGAALNHCVVALAALGWRSTVRRHPDPADPTHLASLELRPDVPADVDIALAAAIPRRRTDPRSFGAWPVAHADVALMGSRAARMGVVMRRVDQATTLRASVDEHGELLAFGTVDDDDLARLRAGEAASVAILTATSLGLASRPVTEVLEDVESRAAIRADAFDDGHFPHVLVRVGWPHVDADPLPATPRRPLGDVVTLLDGTPWD